MTARGRRVEQAIAAAAGRRRDPAYPYWCPAAGAWHITRQPPVENTARYQQLLAARRAEQAAQEPVMPRPHEHNPNMAIPPDHRGERPCICGRASVNRVHDEVAVALNAARIDAEQAEERRRLGEREE